MTKGEELNRRVWTLFEKAGFSTKPNSQSTEEHKVLLNSGKLRKVDLYAEVPALHVKIIGSNKSGGWKDTWSGHVNDFEKIGEKAGAKVLFIVTGKDMTAENIAYAQDEGMCVWGEEKLTYFESVVDAIKEYAKYEIIHDLGIKTKEQKQINRVLALRLRQPATDSTTELFMFSMSPEELLKTCVIYRRAIGNADAYQRMLQKKRLPQIRKFVSTHNALLPTNLILHLGKNITSKEVKDDELLDQAGKPITLTKEDVCDIVTLDIPMAYASLEILDGQHRLFGFVDTDPATRRSFNLVVLGLREMDDRQKRECFVAINDNSRRMDPNLVAYLKYTTDEAACQKNTELMAIGVVVDLNRDTPFKDSIKLLDIASKRITLKGFSGYDLRGLLGPFGELRKYYPENKTDAYVRVLRMYFSSIRNIFEDEWEKPNKYIIATNRGISAFLKLLKSILRTEKRPLTPASIKKYLLPLKTGVEWEQDKLKRSYVGSQGWKEFHRELVGVIKETYPDFSE